MQRTIWMFAAAISTVTTLASTQAWAEDAAPAAAEPAVVGNVGLTTNYKFRGQDQGNNKPAIFGGFDYAFSNGFYVGNWNSSIGFTNAGIEMDFYGGYKGTYSDVGYDVGILQYYYPQKDKSVNFDTTEVYAALSYAFLTGKYSHTVSSKYFGLDGSKNTGYWELNANYEVVKGLTLNGHLGYTSLGGGSVTTDNGDGTITTTDVPDYTDYRVGATYDLGGGLSVAAAVAAATKKDFYGDINKTRFILTLTKAL